LYVDRTTVSSVRPPARRPHASSTRIAGVTLRLHDARRGGRHPFDPDPDQPVGLYVCGVTPYDTGHLGHAFTYVSFDVLNRYLRYRGHEVVYVQNLTDVDDDMLRKARELGEDYLALGNRHVTTFLSEMAALNWLPPDRYPRATQHIPHMQALIGRLLDRGHAYVADGYVYFSIESYPRYGELSRLSRDEMLPIANERGNVPDLPGKRDPLDFVLWQPSAPDEPTWESPWGHGRPGWHIECSAMSIAYLGERFAMHAGGADLVFPHHESELAQSEAATGERPWVEFWLHAGMLRFDSEKMSKSLGNLVLVRDLLRSYSGDAIRHYLLNHHYRSEIDFDADALERSAATVVSLRQVCLVAEEIEPLADGRADPSGLDPRIGAHRDRFLACIDNDLDTPCALRELDALAALAAGPESDLRVQAGWMVRELGARILGLRLASVASVRESDPVTA
jgi:L-cysteine:1D-myo-inositol 2-amino-2-deoxy-alpha-D-glucopyranoside ligase